MALLACLDFELPWCDFFEPPSFVNRYGDLVAADDSQRVVVATNMFAMRRMHALLVLPNSKAEPYASVARMLDETAHRAGVSDTRRASHPCPVVLDPHDAAPRWLTMSLRVMVSQLLVRTGAAIPNHEIWVLDHLIPFPLTPAPPVFRLPFEVSELGHIVGHFYQPRAQSRWAPAGLVTRPRVELTQAESNWFYARLSAFAFYAYCTQLPPYAVWGALRLFFDRVETIVAQDRSIEIDAYKIRSANPALFDAWSRWNEQMALYAHWFVALYQVMERSSTCNLAPVKALVNGVVVETIPEPFRELRLFMSDARDYWPAMYSCQTEFSSLEPVLAPLQRVSRHEATALLQTRLCRRDMTAFIDASLPDEDPNCGSVCYRVPDMLPSHMRATLAHLGFAPDDIASVVMAPHFNGGADAHTYDLFVRMHARHECAWQVASICDLPRAARPLLQRLGCAPRGCLVNRPSVLRVVQRAVLRLCCGPSVVESLDFNAELAFLRDACGATTAEPTAALVFFCSAGMTETEPGRSVHLRTPIGASDADMRRSVGKWSAALATTTSADELLGPMSRARFRDIVRDTVPLLDTVQHLRAFVMFACSNPALDDGLEVCVEIQRGVGAIAAGVVTKPAPAFRPAESVLGAVLTTTDAVQVSTMMRVIETLNAMRAGVFALAAPMSVPEMQNVGWHQTDDDMRLLRERESHARTCGLRLREPPAATRSLALYPDQCALVCASMRNCANGDDLVAELLLGPDAKMNWQPTSSDPDYYRIAQPPSLAKASVRPVAATADARTKAHFGDSLPCMRPSYPDAVRATVHMTAEEVKLANRARSIGQPARDQQPPPKETAATATAPPPPPSRPPASAVVKAKRSKPAPPKVLVPAPAAAVQLNSAGKLIHKKTGTPKPTDKLTWSASMLDFMELDKT